MLPKERVAAAFEHRQSDKVPIYQGGFSSRVASQILGREAFVGGGIQQFREVKALWDGAEAHQEYLQRSQRDAFDLSKALDLDLVRVGYWRQYEEPSARIDEYTFRFGGGERWRVMRLTPETELWQVIDQAPCPEPTDADLEATVDAMEAGTEAYAPQPEHFADMLAAIEEFGDERAVPGGGIGLCIPRERAWLEATALRPDLVRRYLDAQAANSARTAECMSRMGLKYLMGGGDFASARGPFYSPRAFHDLMLPGLKVISAACHAVGAYHMFASDGDLWPVSEDLFGHSGVDCFYEIDRRSGMDLRRLRQTFPDLTLLGGIASETLHIGTPEEVREETRTALEVAQELGGIIVGCSNQVVAPTPMSNFEAMMEVLWAR
jgi:hypothetical protein